MAMHASLVTVTLAVFKIAAVQTLVVGTFWTQAVMLTMSVHQGNADFAIARQI
jgi:hypothetical protein